jgi:superfamily II DNA or RNA helicase
MKLSFLKDKEIFKIVDAERQEFNLLKDHFTRHVEGYYHKSSYKYGGWDGKRSYFERGEIPMGLWKELYGVCQNRGFELEIENRKEFPFDRKIKEEDVNNFCDAFYKGYTTKDGDVFNPYDHQRVGVFKILQNRYCLIEVATSGGKSLIFGTTAFYIRKMINPEAKFLLIVPTKTLVKQFYNDLIGYNTNFDKSEPQLDICIQEMMSGKPRISHEGRSPDIIVSTYHSLAKKTPEFFKQFYCVVSDEAHTADAVTVKNELEATRGSAHIRYGMTGTLPAEDTYEFLSLQALMGPLVHVVPASELIEKGIITPMHIKILTMVHNDKEFGDNLKIIRKSGRGRECYELEKKYTQESKLRTDFIFKFLNGMKKNTLVLFVNISYGKSLYKKGKDNIVGKDFYYIDGTISGDRRQYIIEQMNITDGNPKILIASYKTLSTGVSINALFNILLVDSTKSEFTIIQSIGRMLRKHKEKNKAYIFEMTDIYEDIPKPQNILYKHSLERRGHYDKRQYPWEEIRINL